MRRRLLLLAPWLAWAVAPIACDSPRRAPRAPARAEGLPYPPPPEGSAVPPAGSFAVRSLPAESTELLPGIPLVSGIVPSQFGVQIDYAGPRPRLELVAVERRGDAVLSTTVVHSQVFGAATLRVSGNTAEYADAAPHSRPRQALVLRLQGIDGGGEANTLLTIFSFDATEQASASSDQCTFVTSFFDPELPLGSYSRFISPELDPGRTVPDDATVPLFHMRKDDGRIETVLGVRFR